GNNVSFSSVMYKLKRFRLVIRYSILVLLFVTIFYHTYLFDTITVEQTTGGENKSPNYLTWDKNSNSKNESPNKINEQPHVGENVPFNHGIHIANEQNQNEHEVFNESTPDGKHKINAEKLVDKNNKTKPKNVYFAKTHKAASTTIQNLLFRYGEKYNLTFAMPWNIHRAGYPNHFTPDVIMPLAKGYNEYNVFCHHTRFHPRVLDFMPHDTLYIGAVRSVEKQFLSGYVYHRFYNCYGMENKNITQVLEVMQEYKHGLQCSNWNVSSQSEQMFDFGLQIEDMSNITMIKDYIHYLDSVFDFIFVADYFYESLVLLADI
ncbi:unnamed protein product, partial [Owenia fusiformis]